MRFGSKRYKPVPVSNSLVLSGLRDVLQHNLHIRLPDKAPLHLRILPTSPLHRLPQRRLSHQAYVLQRGLLWTVDPPRARQQHRTQSLRRHPTHAGS